MWGVGSPLWTLWRTPKTCFWGQGRYRPCTLPAQKKEVSGICLAGRKTLSISRGPKAALPRGRAAVCVRGPELAAGSPQLFPVGGPRLSLGVTPHGLPVLCQGLPSGFAALSGPWAPGPEAPGGLSLYPAQPPPLWLLAPLSALHPSDAFVSLFLSIGHHSPLYGQPLPPG